MDAARTSNGYAGKKRFALPAHIMLAERLQSMIKAGELKPGYRFPTTKVFAAQLKTYPLAVHEAFKILSGQGLVERQQRSGTFVSGSSSVLGSVAIYLGFDIMGASYLGFYRLVYAELTRLLKNEGVRYASLLDPRGEDEQDKPWEELASLAERKKYQGIIALAASGPRMKWISRLAVPSSSSIDLDCRMDDFTEKSVTALKGKGCRSVGMITTYFPDRSMKFSGHFMELAGRNKMKTSRKWIKLPEIETYVPGPLVERYGYERFLELWNSRQRPEGLVVYPDILLPGVISAMAHLRIRAPEDIKLAVHMNKGNGIFCAFPATFIVTDPADFAAALIRQLKVKLSGRAAVPEKIFFKAMEFQT
ncbi:MAG: substrate-binding domain-containing protein [Victivallales bacterium]